MSLKFFFAFCDVAERWRINIQDPATPYAEGMYFFHIYLVSTFCIIGILVCWILYCLLYNINDKRFESKNVDIFSVFMKLVTNFIGNIINELYFMRYTVPCKYISFILRFIIVLAFVHFFDGSAFCDAGDFSAPLEPEGPEGKAGPATSSSVKEEEQPKQGLSTLAKVGIGVGVGTVVVVVAIYGGALMIILTVIQIHQSFGGNINDFFEDD
jgi:hypothetical protein